MQVTETPVWENRLSLLCVIVTHQGQRRSRQLELTHYLASGHLFEIKPIFFPPPPGLHDAALLLGAGMGSLPGTWFFQMFHTDAMINSSHSKPWEKRLSAGACVPARKSALNPSPAGCCWVGWRKLWLEDDFTA